MAVRRVTTLAMGWLDAEPFQRHEHERLRTPSY